MNAINFTREYRRGQDSLHEFREYYCCLRMLVIRCGQQSGADERGAQGLTRFHYRRTVEKMTFTNRFSGSGLRSTFAWRMAP